MVTPKILILVCLVSASAFQEKAAHWDESVLLKPFTVIDSIASSVIQISSSTGCTQKRLKHLGDSLVKFVPYVYSLVIADGNGRVIVDCRVNESEKLTGNSVFNTKWYQNAVQSGDLVTTGIVRIDSKKVLCKSWSPLAFDSVPKPVVCALLIDLEAIVANTRKMSDVPIALHYKGSVVFEHGAVNGTANRTIFIPHVSGLQWVAGEVGGKKELLKVRSTFFGKVAGLHVESMVVTGSLIVGIAGLVLFIFGRISFLKLKSNTFIEYEKKKLSSDEHNKIHELAVSHVYCEIKRQLETHERLTIEKRVRQHLEEEIKEILCETFNTKNEELVSD